MAFRVEVAPQASRDLDAIATYIAKHGSFDQAQAWFNSIMGAIAALRELPNRCPVAEESEDLGGQVRLLLHGRRNRRYKVYFSIQLKTPAEGIVRVFHVRHWARHRPNAGELQKLL